MLKNAEKNLKKINIFTGKHPKSYGKEELPSENFTDDSGGLRSKRSALE